jgi:hypothetical protein
MITFDEKYDYVFDFPQLYGLKGGTRDIIPFLQERKIIDEKAGIKLSSLRNSRGKSINNLNMFVEIVYKLLKDNNL